jgi:Calcineurin-like phosphoesterase superfamily domain
MKNTPLFNGPVCFQGDAHGKLNKLAKPGCPVIHVGDLGIGFVAPLMVREKVTKRNDFWFIRGNHDCPELCRKNPNYLGEFGGSSSLFWVSGAWSIDHAYRTEGRDWWRDEELSASQMNSAFDDYLAAKPRVMVTHDGPDSLFQAAGPMAIPNYHASATSRLLQEMLQAHSPELWVFGHHHVSRDFQFKGARFRCLAELETFDYCLQTNYFSCIS